MEEVILSWISKEIFREWQAFGVAEMLSSGDRESCRNSVKRGVGEERGEWILLGLLRQVEKLGY